MIKGEFEGHFFELPWTCRSIVCFMLLCMVVACFEPTLDVH